MQWTPPTSHQPLEQRHEQRAGQATFEGHEPEGAGRRHRRRRADALALPGDAHDGRCAARAPRGAVHRIGAEARLVPERDLRAVSLCAFHNRGIAVTLPRGDGHRIALVRALQGLLHGEIEPGEERADGRERERDGEPVGNQRLHHLTRPEAEIEPVLQRRLAMHPPKHLAFLRRCQRPRASGGASRAQHPEATTSAPHGRENLVGPRAL